MSLFGFGKKKNEKEKAPVCACSCGCSAETTKTESCCCQKADGEILSIKVLGAGCPSCHTLLTNTKEAVTSMGISVEVEYVTDMPKIMEYGIMSLPALVVNENVVSMGKVLKSSEVEALFHKLGF